jgi:SAM-dependent methyltransferase
MNSTWADFLSTKTLFMNAIQQKELFWTIQRYIPAESELLEVGFGSGATAVLLADIGYHITAVDIDPTLVNLFIQRYPEWIATGRVDVRQADMFSLPWKDKTFELAYHQGVLEHHSDDEILMALKEEARISNWIIFDVPNGHGKKHHFGDERLLPPSHWRNLIRKAGVSLVEEVGRNFPRWMYILPHAFFSRQSLYRWPWFSRVAGRDSIFVCKCN